MTPADAVSAGPELVVGLIGPLGVDLKLLCVELSAAFAAVSYVTREISLVEAVLQFQRWKNTPSTPFDVRYERRMDAGNELRSALKRNDALALLSLGAVQHFRARHHDVRNDQGPPSPIPRCAYLLRSLKTPEEVATLRHVYGSNFVAISAYMPRDARRDALKRRIAESIGDPETHRHEATAAALLARDEFESKEFGQNMRETFPLADVFVDVSNPGAVAGEVRRFVEILFGHPNHTPRRAEMAMFYANGAKLRSSSAGRQVGASIVSSSGDLVAVGTNEVGKAYGGQYWSDEENGHDHRDYQRAVDSTSAMLSSILTDFLCRMQRRGWLSEKQNGFDLDRLRNLGKQELLPPLTAEETLPGDPPTLADKALLEKLLEYMRPVHAEMAAITTCARLGLSAEGCEMYVTTFPCHECAKLIIASGVKSVRFIEPYPKSRVAEMYDDSIVVDREPDTHHISFQAFVGVAPRRFVEFFEAPEPTGRNPQSDILRRNSDGSSIRWEHVRNARWPRQYDIPLAIMTREQNLLDKVNKWLMDSHLRPVQEENHEQQPQLDG